MSGNNRFIRIAQQPPAIVKRGDLFNFIAYFPKSSPYEYQEDVQDANCLGGKASFPTYRSGGFATTSVIPADGRMILSSSSSLEKWNDGIVVGTGRADFNRTNENDRTIKFELRIKGTGAFIVVVRLHRQHMRASRVGGNGSETWTNSIITSVVTRKIQVCSCVCDLFLSVILFFCVWIFAAHVIKFFPFFFVITNVFFFFFLDIRLSNRSNGRRIMIRDPTMPDMAG